VHAEIRLTHKTANMMNNRNKNGLDRKRKFRSI